MNFRMAVHRSALVHRRCSGMEELSAKCIQEGKLYLSNVRDSLNYNPFVLGEATKQYFTNG